MFGYPHWGLGLSGSGRYTEAMDVFAKAEKFGREHGIWSFLARSVSMSAGLHLDILDFQGHEVLCEEARELSRRGDFTPTLVSANIDLLLNYARRNEPGGAEKLLDATSEAVVSAGGWHGWLWKIRLEQARGELALAREDWPEALRWSGLALANSRNKRRLKYEVLALGTQGQALHRLGRTRESIQSLQEAVGLARGASDPTVFLRPAVGLLALDGDDALLRETRATAARIFAALPEGQLRERFREADVLRALGPIA